MTASKYRGKTLFLEEQSDGRYTLYNWYHAPIATEELEALIPIIRAWQPLPEIKATIILDELALDLDLPDLERKDND